MTVSPGNGVEAYPRLLSPITVGSRTLQNRVVILPHGTSMVADGAITEGDIAYYRRRAETRPGMIVTGAAVVHPSSARRQRILVENYSDKALPGLAERAAMMRSHGVVAIGQLIHLGREMIGIEGDWPTLAPSPIRSPRDFFSPQRLDEASIAELVNAFGQCALNLRQTGHDGTEIHAAHGYLPAQFLSPATNERTDLYGGDRTRRFRFLREVVESIRKSCGTDFLIGVRLSADEETGEGLEIPDTIDIAQRLQEMGCVDYLSITLGVRGAYVKDTTQPEAPAARAAASIRAACDIPVILGQKITRPALAEQLLADGHADMIGMARALIADENWLDHARTGNAEQIRPCIGLNQDCRAFSPHLHCAVNPATGRELNAPFADLVAASEPRAIAIVGAGPAGLEIARTLALRGHRPTVYEKRNHIGGQFAYAAGLPHRHGLLKLIDFYASELRRLNVPVHMGIDIAGPGDLRHAAETIVVATGAEPNPVPDGFIHPNVVSWWQVLEEGAPSPRGSHSAMMIDDGTGFWWNYGVAEMLVQAGWRLTYATPSAAIGHQIPGESVGPLLARLGHGKTEFRVLSQLMDVTDDAATLINMSSGETTDYPCDLIVIHAGRTPVPTNLTARFDGIEIHRIGDALSPRRMANAVFEAQRLGRQL